MASTTLAVPALPVSELTTITPEMAGDFLATQRLNRKLRGTRVNRYARMLAADKWQLTGEPIIFDSEGHLTDGQHRLTAIIVSGVPMTTFVVRGVERDAFKNTDSGAVRSLADTLDTMGYHNTPYLASALINLETYRQYGDMRTLSNDARATRDDLLERMEAEPDLAVAVATATGGTMPGAIVPRGYKTGVYMACLHLFLRLDYEDAMFFDEHFKFGMELTLTDPIFHLRKRLNEWPERMGSANANARAGLICKTWNLYRGDEQVVKQLVWRAGGPAPEVFPVPR